MQSQSYIQQSTTYPMPIYKYSIVHYSWQLWMITYNIHFRQKVSESMVKYVSSELVREWVSEWVSEKVSERVSEWLREKMLPILRDEVRREREN